MAEVVAGVASGLSIASFAIQVSDKIFQIKQFLDIVKSAPLEIRLCLDEIQLLNDILLDWEIQNPASSNDATTRRCADLCRKTVDMIVEILNEFQAKIGKRRRLGSVKFALKRGDIDRILGRLERIKTTLNVAHVVIGPRLLQAQWREDHDNTIRAVTAQLKSDTSSMPSSPPSSSSPLPLTLKESQHNTSRRPTFRLALPIWLSGRVWEIYTARSQIEGAFRYRMYNIISHDALIFKYASDGDVDELQKLLRDKQASVFDCNDRGHTALMIAAFCGQVRACQCLLNAGADPCATSYNDATIFHYISYFRYYYRAFRKQRGRVVIEQIARDIQDFTLTLLPKTEDIIAENPRRYMRILPSNTFPSIIAAVYPPFHQRPLSERINLCRNELSASFIGFRKAEHIPLILTAEEKENIFLYREQLLPLILESCATTIPSSPDELGGYHLLLTRVLNNYANDLKGTYTCSSPQSLVFLCLRIWVESFYHCPIKHESERVYWYLQKGHIVPTPIRILARAMQAAGVDLLQLGHEENLLLAKRVVAQDIECRYSSGEKLYTIRFIGFNYGPEPEDWYYWLSDYRDEYVGEFWNMIENAEPELRVPGAWVD